MLNFIKRRIKVIIGILSIGVVVSLVYLNLKPATPPQIVATTPADKSSNVLLLSPVSLQFEDVVENSDFTTTSEPSLDWTITQKASTIISLEHTKPFKPNTTYMIKVSWRGASIATINLRTQQSETDYVLLDRLHDEIKSKYPLAAKLPYTTNNYSVLYSAELTLEITPKATALTQEEMLTQVKDWVRQNGVDPATHKYVISTGTPTP